jgi:hypothetical protein
LHGIEVGEVLRQRVDPRKLLALEARVDQVRPRAARRLPKGRIARSLA